jgi:hypothetical protein
VALLPAILGIGLFSGCKRETTAGSSSIDATKKRSAKVIVGVTGLVLLGAKEDVATIKLPNFESGMYQKNGLHPHFRHVTYRNQSGDFAAKYLADEDELTLSIKDEKTVSLPKASFALSTLGDPRKFELTKYALVEIHGGTWYAAQALKEWSYNVACNSSNQKKYLTELYYSIIDVPGETPAYLELLNKGNSWLKIEFVPWETLCEALRNNHERIQGGSGDWPACQQMKDTDVAFVLIGNSMSGDELLNGKEENVAVDKHFGWFSTLFKGSTVKFLQRCSDIVQPTGVAKPLSVTSVGNVLEAGIRSVRGSNCPPVQMP